MTNPKQDPAPAQVPTEELSEEQLDQANGGIIAVLIGLAKDPPKVPGGANVLLGDGSVRN